jgi:ribosomal protein RSM22 (predicted rRNA methylase)
MPLPDELRTLLEQKISSLPMHQLVHAATELSIRYRSSERDKFSAFMTSEAHRLAYLITRLPATFSVVKRVLGEFAKRLPEFKPKTCCDLGAGPGTATWAAIEVFNDLQQISLFEQDLAWTVLGNEFMQKSQYAALANAKWHQYDLAQMQNIEAHDLVMMSYVIGEIPLERLCGVIEWAWRHTRQALVIIEPGTPHGFARIREARKTLIDLGAHIVAPCPHHMACPMSGNDWCHFAERLDRSWLHKYLKAGTLGYEDEKYSYVVASGLTPSLPQARILRVPQKHSGHMDLSLCMADGAARQVKLSRRHGTAYKQARKLDWGDAIEKIDIQL